MTRVAPTDKAGQVRSGLTWSLTSSLAMRLGNVLLSMVMARLIAPEEFGVFAVALTVWTILSALSEFGLGSDLVRAADPERRAPTVATLGLLIGTGAAVTMALSAPLLAQAFRSPESAPVVAVMAIALALFGLTIVPAARLQRGYQQRTLFLVNGTGLLLSALTIVTLALLDLGPMALAWGQVAGQATIVVGLYVATRSRPRLGWDGGMARESLAFCVPLATANLVSWLLITLDNVIVSRELSPTALGLYVLAFNVSSWPMSAVGQAVRVVALPAFADSGSVEERNRGLVRAVGPTVLVATLMGLLLATLSRQVITVLYGERWAAASTALVGLAVFGAVRVLLDLVATFLIAAGDTRQVLMVQLLWLVAMLPVMVLCVRAWGLAGAGWAHVAVVLVVVLPAYAVFLRRAGVDLRALAAGSVVPVAAVVPAALACTLVARGVGTDLTTLLVGGLVAGALYVGPLVPWLRRRLHDLRHHSDPQPGEPAVATTATSAVNVPRERTR